MRRLQSFWGHEVAHFGPLDGFLSMDLEVPFFRLKLGRTSTLTMLSVPFKDQIKLQLMKANEEIATFCCSWL